MKSRRVKLFSGILFILLLLILAYYYRADIARVERNISHEFQPCRKPLTYSIVRLDAEFGFTEEELLTHIQKAENIWEESINKQLFDYSATGDVEINLIYDSRQQATDTLKEIGLVINDDRATFDTLKIKYDSLLISYKQKKIDLDILVEKYNSDKESYEQDVNDSNSHGGASKEQFELLEQRRLALNNQVKIINQEREALNILINSINSAEIVLNKLINTLNLKINSYNAIGASNGEHFNEGEYISDGRKNVINIYQFKDQNELISVLAHELGHALGMEHIDNTQAIMYYLNEGGGENLTINDLSELKRVCRMQ